MQKSDFQRKYLSITLGSTLALAMVLGIVLACTGSDTQAKAKPNYITKDAPKPGVLAKIGDEEITEEKLVGDDKMDFLEIEKRKYDLRMEKLNNLVEDRIIGAEAKKAGMPQNEYIDKKILKGDVKVGDAEIGKFAKERHIPENQVSQYKDRIIQFIKQQKRQEAVQAYLAKATKDHPVEVYFKKPKIEMQVDAGNSPMFGGKDAKVTIVEFSDFQCPYCSRAAETVSEIKKKYGNKIKLHFRQFPLQMHPQARPASEAALCVNEQGVDKFWKFHDLAFKNQDKLDPAGLEKMAKDAGADVNKYKECANAKKFAQAVQDDFAYGEKLGVRSTPTFFINGQLVAGALPIESFSEIIDEELAKK